jgi:hypothetical protein
LVGTAGDADFHADCDCDQYTPADAHHRAADGNSHCDAVAIGYNYGDRDTDGYGDKRGSN